VHEALSINPHAGWLELVSHVELLVARGGEESKEASGSFLKKRTKKLLFYRGSLQPHRPRRGPNNKSFLLLFSKKKFFLTFCAALEFPF
jgi:hypothetical protein